MAQSSLGYDIVTLFYLGIVAVLSEPVAQVVIAGDLYGASGMNIWIVRAVAFAGMGAALLGMRSAQKPSKVRRPQRQPEQERGERQ